VKEVKRLKDFISSAEQGKVYMQESPCGNLVLFNYTPETQFSRDWDSITLASRGIIFEKDSGSIIARPFGKFFNMEEHAQEGMEPIPNEDFEVYEKVDGSLGIIYWYNFRWNVATRGSFSSEQAIKAEKMLYDLYNVERLDPQFTYLVEIIYPENRILIDYGDDEALVLLAVVDTASGKEDSIENWTHIGWGTALKYDFKCFNAIKALDWNNSEGFVIRFKNGFRMKIKFDNYVKLHRIMTEMTPKRIFEAWESGIPVSENLEDVPDEIFDEIKEWESKFEKEYGYINLEVYTNLVYCKNGLEDINSNRETRKLFAERALKTEYHGIMFGMLDGRDVHKAICKEIYKKFFH